MRILLLLSVIVAGCGSDGNVVDVDQGALPTCPPGASESHTARCQPGVDTQCLTGNYVAHCLCTGYWETDQVLVACDPDLGTPHEPHD